METRDIIIPAMHMGLCNDCKSDLPTANDRWGSGLIHRRQHKETDGLPVFTLRSL